MSILFLIQSLLVPFQPCVECDLLRKGWEHQTELRYDSAISYYKRAIPIAQENNHKIYVGYSLINLGNAFGGLLNWDSAIQYNRLALTVFEDTQDEEQQFYCRLNIAQALVEQGLYRSALNELEMSSELLKTFNDPKKSFQVEIARGRSWLELTEYDRSMKSYAKARNICKEHNLLSELNLTLLDIGNVHLEQNKLDSAFTLYQRALVLAHQTSDSSFLAMAYNNLGITAFKKNQNDEAQEYLVKAIKLKKSWIPQKITTSYMYLGKVFLNRNQLIAAKPYLDSALSSQDFEVQIGANEGLVKYYQLTGDYKQAFETIQLLDSLKNRQFNTERLEANKLQATIDLNNVNSKLNQQVLINENQKMINGILMGIGFVVLIAASVLFILFRTNLKLRKYNELLLKEQNHRVKNNLQMINSLLSLHAQKLLSSDAKEALNESQNRINSVALLHRMLYEGKEPGTIEFEEYLHNLVKEISYTSPRTIDWNILMESNILITVEQATSLGLIVNELITNSVKHVDASILLALHLTVNIKHGEIGLHYQDNGQVFDVKLWETSESFGNQLIRLQSEQLRGNYEIQSNNGFQFKLTIAA